MSHIENILYIYIFFLSGAAGAIINRYTYKVHLISNLYLWEKKPRVFKIKDVCSTFCLDSSHTVLYIFLTSFTLGQHK